MTAKKQRNFNQGKICSICEEIFKTYKELTLHKWSIHAHE